MPSDLHPVHPQLARLYAALGDHLAGGRPDGIFEARLGGPGSVPGLDDLGAAEWQLDLLPFPPTEAQRAALAGLGYALAAETENRLTYTLTLSDALNVTLLSHDLGASHEQKVLWEYLSQPAEEHARSAYRRAFLASGRFAADAEFVPLAQAAHVARTGVGPLDRAAALLSPLGIPWMFAAGWALDLHRHSISGLKPSQPRDEASRPHEDVDVVVGREHQLVVGKALTGAGYRVSGVREGAYVPWTEPLEPPHFQLHAHREGHEMLDLMLTDLSGDLWHYRRDPAVTLPLARARLVSTLGLPYLAPEAALLFKATGANGRVRPKDQRDFEAVLPALGAAARGWLATRLGEDHRWQAALRAVNPE
ncbi:hypothetical protein [Deinococcus altitudinis]|uniref:hypothetical protein n=1 Tax=Deinococcus altitudinis TaxID=468914 RepID=UPI00389240BC